MVLMKVLLQIICFQQTLSLDLSLGSPVPHAELLDDFLSATYFKNYTETNSISVFDYLFGDNFTDLENSRISDHLDICVLSPENLKKVVEGAQRKYMLELKSHNESLNGISRRKFVYWPNYEFDWKAMSWMQQSIYGTRRRLEVTRPYRKKFHNDISYNIGILYGILKEMGIKLDSFYALLKHMTYREHFLWFLFAYQRILGLSLDISYAVQRMFEFQRKWNILIGRKDKGDYIEVGEEPESSRNFTGYQPDISSLLTGQEMPSITGEFPPDILPDQQNYQGHGEGGPKGVPEFPGNIHGEPNPYGSPGSYDKPNPYGAPGSYGGPGSHGDPGSHRDPGAYYDPGAHRAPDPHSGLYSQDGPGPYK